MSEHGSEAGLEHVGAYFLGVVEASQDCIRVLSLDGHIEYMNRRGQALFGITDYEGHRGKIWGELWPAETRHMLHRAVRDARAGKVASFRAICPTLGGVRKCWDTVVTPVRDGDGQVIRLLATSRDVTAEVETRSFCDTIIDLLPNPLLVKSAADGRYVLVNRAAEDMLGVAAEDILGKSAFDLFPQSEAELFTAEDKAVIAAGSVCISEEEPISVDGELRYFTTKKLATYDDDGPRHLVAMGEDVTNRRAAAQSLQAALEEAQQASRAKSAFLANMSHEIRTPLNGIVAGADMLSRQPLSPKMAELVEIIRSSSGSLQTLLTDILDLARIEAGAVRLEYTPFHLGDLIRSVAALGRLKADEKGVSVTVQIAPELEGEAQGDPTRLRQVITNLVSNAVKFTDAGKVVVTAGLVADGAVRIAVRDSGIGFDDSDKSRIFGRFQQADTSITRRFGGAGLGLAISGQLVELMGGALDCASKPGEGAQFWFDLPMPVRPAQAAAAVEAQEAEFDRPLRILLADDHPINRKVVELMLAGVAEICSVENGAEAVQAFQDGQFDAVLMDMQMPVMDGLSAVRAIRRHELGLGAARTPVIMLTANALPEHVAASAECGADRHLDKPINAEKLLSVLEEVLDQADEAVAA
ncbi:PAS domain S-box-containing protein [Caulobacter ginsengisoli]|uniref:histidine kinase n=1 Tax=Caulobacter ginsengisoli TaxID=400775 RepID=A0ABU0IX46_9CAUL|nr:PAS domain-containing protein [Caulobacter ginsengisoli]MDQ0466586.1 PAS domain S-box-containing protein [Caulobacter ginsengisoli]